MTAFSSKCSECGELLSEKRRGAKTCGPKCRAKRSRRLRRQRSDAGRKGTEISPEVQPIAAASRTPKDAADKDTRDIAHKVMAEELRPVIRESITDDTLAALRDMVALAPTAVAALARDLQAEDPAQRQKATELWFRYTVGQKNIVTPEQEAAKARMIVNFDMPRPSDPQGDDVPEEEGVIAEAEELRVCDVCRHEKSASEFVAASTRCKQCHDEMVSKVSSYLDGGGKDGAD